MKKFASKERAGLCSCYNQTDFAQSLLVQNEDHRDYSKDDTLPDGKSR